MEKIELTGPELIEKLGWKKSKVYYWMSTGKFQTIETPEGLKALLTEQDIEKYKIKNKSQTDSNIPEIFQENSSPVQNNLKISDNEIMLEAIKTIRYMFDNQINQTKLLVDSEEMTKSDFFELKVQFQTLQNSYKKLELENKELYGKNVQLETENKSLKEQLEKKSSFLGIFKK
jgi:hypothetical protein